MVHKSATSPPQRSNLILNARHFWLNPKSQSRQSRTACRMCSGRCIRKPDQNFLLLSYVIQIKYPWVPLRPCKATLACQRNAQRLVHEMTHVSFWRKKSVRHKTGAVWLTLGRKLCWLETGLKLRSWVKVVFQFHFASRHVFLESTLHYVFCWSCLEMKQWLFFVGLRSVSVWRIRTYLVNEK